MAKIQISKDAVLQPGDVVEMHYKVIGPVWLKAIQIAAIESRLEKDARFSHTGTWFEGENDRTLVVRITILPPRPKEAAAVLKPGEVPEVQEAGVPIAGIIIAVAAAAAAVFVWLSLDRIFKVVEAPGGAVGVGLMGAAVAGLVILFLLKRG